MYMFHTINTLNRGRFEERLTFLEVLKNKYVVNTFSLTIYAFQNQPLFSITILSFPNMCICSPFVL